MIREVTMYQAVCDGCAKINSPCKTHRKATYIQRIEENKV